MYSSAHEALGRIQALIDECLDTPIAKYAQRNSPKMHNRRMIRYMKLIEGIIEREGNRVQPDEDRYDRSNVQERWPGSA